MRRVRRALGPLAVVWLVWQAGTLVFVPTALWVGVALADTSECTCAHGDHAICPMHHNSAGRSRLCVLQSAHDNGVAVLSSLLGHVGLVPVPTETAVPLSEHAVVLLDLTTSSLRPAPPDPPPPRA